MVATKILSGKGYRVASKAMGDDTTRARFVRVALADRKEGRRRRANKPRLPGFEAAFIQEGRTKFSKAVQAPNKNILVSGHNNIKIGRDVRKGHLRGYWIYTLSLQERATCPRSCQHWQTCYGNNMPFAKRVDHTDRAFLSLLEASISKLCAMRNRKGILVRLHALGDFYSVAYVQFWQRMLLKYPKLCIYGYTARMPEHADGIGVMIEGMNWQHPGRSMIRFSDGKKPLMSTVSIGGPESCPPDAFICPEQTGKTLGCDTCGVCWGTTKNVAFMEH